MATLVFSTVDSTNNEVNRLNKVVFLVPSGASRAMVWMGARGKAEMMHLDRFGKTFR